MSCLVLIARLAVRDLRHRRAQAVLLLLSITAATATLTLGLALNGVTSSPYLRTKAATSGPDITAFISSAAQAAPLSGARGVSAHSGPYPLASPVLRFRGLAVPVQAEGRDEVRPRSISRT